jgi:hypothetical protein
MKLNPKFQIPLTQDEILKPFNDLEELEKLEPWRKHDYKFFAFCLAGIRQYYRPDDNHPNDLFTALSVDYEIFLAEHYFNENSWESFERQASQYFANLID